MNINTVDLNRPQKFSKLNTFPQKQPQFKGQKKEAPAGIKMAAALSSLAGTGLALGLVAKRQGFSLNPNVIRKTPVKDWAIFRIAERKKPDKKLLEIEEKEILTLAGGSIIGGLTGGTIVDSKNIKSKFRETLTQSIGNILIPVGFVGGTSRIYRKFEKQIKNSMPQFITKGKKPLKYFNKFVKNIPAIGITGAALAAGIYTGSKVTNFINGKFFGQKNERKIKSADLAPHVDDLCLAVTLMGSKNSPVASAISKTVPLFLAVPGYQIGKAQEN